VARRRRERGGEVRSGKNAIVGAAGREERRQVRAPHSERVRSRRRRGKARRKGGLKDTITADCRGQLKPEELIGRIILWESAAIPDIFAIALCKP